MGAMDVRRTLNAGLLAACAFIAACGDERPAEPVASTSPEQPAAETTQATAPVPVPDPDPGAVPKRTEEEQDRLIDAALRALEVDDMARRREAVQALLSYGFELGDIVRLAFRATRWQEDRGLLADLLSDYPREVLPLLLRRIGHSAPVHRARICQALGSARENRIAAFSVVLLRALLDEFEGVRSAARTALGQLSLRGPEIIRLHEASFVERVDGSIGGLLPSVILGPHPDPAYVAVLVDVLIYELRRFPGSDSFFIAGLLGELAGGANATGRVIALLQEEHLYGDLLIRVLVGAGTKGLPLLGSNLRQGVYVNETLEALARMGAPGAELVEVVTPYLVQRRYGRAAVRALWHIQARSDAAQVGLFRHWEKEHTREDKHGDTASEAALLLRLMRPGREVMDLVVGRFQEDKLDLRTQTALLGFLGWCAEEERGRARAVIEAFLATKPLRGVRRRGRMSLRLLDVPEAEMRDRVRRALADGP